MPASALPAAPPLLPSDPIAINAVLIAVRQAAQVLCDRATLLVLLHAHTGACRYAEFAERTGLASRLLSTRLTQLTEHELLVRIPYSRRPLRHAYHLTHMGVALFDVLALLATWEQAWPVPGEPGAMVEVQHLGCAPAANPAAAGSDEPGHGVRLQCATCHTVVDPRDIELRVSQKEMTQMPAKSTATRRTSQEPGRQASDAAATPLPQALSVLGDKWSIEVLVCAFFGIHQFGDFGTRMGIATNILADRLTRLVDAGLLRRTTEGGAYRKGVYLLTRKGRSFYAILIAIQSWADDWIDHRVRSPVKLRHAPCQKPLQPVLVCAACGQAMTHANAALRIGAGPATPIAPRPLAEGDAASPAPTGADTLSVAPAA